MESLDYETVTDYSFTVTATDGGGLNDSSLVLVTIMDANDNRPRFEQELYTVAVEEGDYSQSSFNLLSVSYYASVMEAIVGWGGGRLLVRLLLHPTVVLLVLVVHAPPY